MDAQTIINRIARSERRTPVRLFVRERLPLDYGSAKVFGVGDRIVFGEWSELKPLLDAQRERIEDIVIESDCRNSAVPLMSVRDIPARIEPGAIIREGVSIGRNAVIMMGAVLNIGAAVGEGSMIDMNAVLGGRAAVGKNCHIGAGAVLAGVIEPPSAQPVTVGDNAYVGANAVISEGVHIGTGAVVGAGAVVLADVPDNAVAVGVPARIVKMRNDRTDARTAVVDALRSL